MWAWKVLGKFGGKGLGMRAWKVRGYVGGEKCVESSRVCGRGKCVESLRGCKVLGSLRVREHVGIESIDSLKSLNIARKARRQWNVF